MKLFYDLRIATKLIVAFSAVLALSALLGIFSIFQLGHVNQTTVEMRDNWLPSVRAVLEMKAAMARYRSVELQHILSADEATMTKYEKRMEDFLNDFRKNQGQYQKLISEPEEKAIYGEFASQWEQYLAESKKMIALSRDNKTAEATAVSRGDSTRLSVAMNDKIEKLIQINLNGSVKAGHTAEAVYSTSRMWIVIGLAVNIALGTLLALWIARIVSRPLNQALNVAQTVAAGDLTSRIDVTSKDETGMLLQALKHMNDSLLRIVGEVRGGAETIATASNQIASGNHDLSSRTEEQASSLEETASSMEELTSTVKHNADNARQANGLATSASEIALKGGAVVSQVVDTMGSINESARKIVDIIGVIDGIAFQTNILALNAAVEAARAGEQGRGFAVVASEVRTLAQRSAAAAKDIKTLIGDSVAKVDAGTKLVGQAGATMDDIVESVKRVTDIMGEISAATHEQTSGIEQINQAIMQMDQVTQQNASLVEEAAAASESMQEQAKSLAQAVSVFKLVGTQASLAAPVARVHSLPQEKASVKPIVRKAVAKGRVAVAPPQPRRVAITQTTSDDDWEQF